jgi:hypothetical protein
MDAEPPLEMPKGFGWKWRFAMAAGRAFLHTTTLFSRQETREKVMRQWAYVEEEFAVRARYRYADRKAEEELRERIGERAYEEARAILKREAPLPSEMPERAALYQRWALIKDTHLRYRRRAGLPPKIQEFFRARYEAEDRPRPGPP